MFVNAALHEPFGLTLIEAAAAGVPVVATRHGGPSEIITALEHGLLVEPRDEDAIATACLTILSDPDTHTRMSANGRSGSALYAWDRYAMESTALYARLPRTPGLLASDIDHTLTGCRVGAHDFAAWRQASDLPFVVATGRSFAMARIILSQWGIPEPDAFITDVGTRIMLKGAARMAGMPGFCRPLNEGWDRKAVVAALKALAPAPAATRHRRAAQVSYFGTAEDADRVRENAGRTGPVRQDRVLARTADRRARAMGGKAAAVAAYARRLDLPMARASRPGTAATMSTCSTPAAMRSSSAMPDTNSPTSRA